MGILVWDLLLRMDGVEGTGFPDLLGLYLGFDDLCTHGNGALELNTELRSRGRVAK